MIRAIVRWQNNGDGIWHLPSAGCCKFDAFTLRLGLSVAGLLTDVNFLAVLGLGTAQTLFFGNADLLLDVCVVVLGSVDGG